MTTNDETFDRRRAVVIAGHEGNERLARNALTDTDHTVRELALSALHRIGTLTDVDLTTALTDISPLVRRRATELAALYPTVDLLVALHDNDALVTEVAAWACGEHVAVSPQILDRLIELTTTHNDPIVRESCAAALGAIGDAKGLSAILAACNDKPAVRRRAVLALAPFDGPEVDSAIDAALQDRDWQVRQSAEDLRR